MKPEDSYKTTCAGEELRSSSEQRMAMPREQEPSVARTSDTVGGRGVGGYFDECREKCPYHQPVPNGAGGTEHDCAHRENSPHLPIDQTPCDARVCPLFTSNDPDGDEENMRYAHEIEGEYCLPVGGVGRAADWKKWATNSGAQGHSAESSDLRP